MNFLRGLVLLGFFAALGFDLYIYSKIVVVADWKNPGILNPSAGAAPPCESCWLANLRLSGPASPA